MLLTPLELAELTGRPHAKRQIQWLTVRGWVFEIGADNRPKVSRSYAEGKMGSQGQARQWEPDWSKV